MYRNAPTNYMTTEVAMELMRLNDPDPNLRCTRDPLSTVSMSQGFTGAAASVSIVFAPRQDLTDPADHLFEYTSGITLEEEEPIYQYFPNASFAKQVFLDSSRLLNYRNASIKISGKNFFYDVGNYIVNVRSYIPPHTLVWEKHLPLGDLPPDTARNLVVSNVLKLLWDICLALNVLHSRGLVHGDCRLNSIAVSRGNFVLGGFECVRPGDGSSDLYQLCQSIKYRLGKDWIKVCDNIPKAKNVPLFMSELIMLNYPEARDMWHSTIA